MTRELLGVMSALNYILKIELHKNGLELIGVTLTLPLWGNAHRSSRFPSVTESQPDKD